MPKEDYLEIEKCFVCGKQTHDSASLILRREISQKDHPVDLHFMSLYCCYLCFYGSVCKAMDDHRITRDLMQRSKDEFVKGA